MSEEHPKSASEAVAMAILAFLPHAGNAGLRDVMERHFFEPAPRGLLGQLELSEDLVAALDLCAELDDAWDLGPEIREASVDDIRKLLIAARMAPKRPTSRAERDVFRDLLRRGDADHALPRSVRMPIARRMRVQQPVPSTVRGMATPEPELKVGSRERPHAAAAA